MTRRYERKETGAALRGLLGRTGEQPFIIIRTTKPNMITEGVKIDPIRSWDARGVIQLACRSSAWNGLRFCYWSDNGDNTGENEITYIEY